MEKNRGREKSRPHEADDYLKQALIEALEDQFYPAQKAVATQLANAVDRAGFMTNDALSAITRQVFVPAMTAEFTEQGAEELYQILRCAYREHKAPNTKKPKDPATGAAMKPAAKQAKEVAGGHEQVLVAMTKTRISKVLGAGTRTKIGTKVQGPTPQLDVVIGGMQPMPKPRKSGIVDEEQWVLALQKAREEVRNELEVPGELQHYYASMCLVGQRLLVSTIIHKAQCIYDYKLNRMIYRHNRKQKGPPCL